MTDDASEVVMELDNADQQLQYRRMYILLKQCELMYLRSDPRAESRPQNCVFRSVLIASFAGEFLNAHVTGSLVCFRHSIVDVERFLVHNVERY